MNNKNTFLEGEDRGKLPTFCCLILFTGLDVLKVLKWQRGDIYEVLQTVEDRRYVTEKGVNVLG